MGNKAGIDMGNSFQFISRRFHEHVLESNVSCGAAAAVCEVGLEGPTKPVAIVSDFWIEPQEWLQMERTIRTRGPARAVRSLSPSASLAGANFGKMAGPDTKLAPTASKLGKPKAGRSFAARIQAWSDSQRARDWEVAQANETEPAWPSPYSAGSPGKQERTDLAHAKQSSLDRGFQRVVSDPGWATSGTLDGTGFVQSLLAGYPIVGGSKLEAGPPDFCGSLWTLWLSGDHPRGQRWSFRIERSHRAFALECLVDGRRDRRRIHRPGTSRTERRARTDASGLQGRDHATGFAK
jgi:hypothetical protein